MEATTVKGSYKYVEQAAVDSRRGFLSALELGEGLQTLNFSNVNML